MTGYDTRGARFPLTITRGADLAFELTVTDSLAAAVNLSAATIAAEIYTTAGVLAATMGDAVSGAGSNIVTLTMTDAATELLTDTKYVWTLWVTRGANTAAWLAGDVYVGDGTTGQSGATSGSQALTVDGDLSVSVTVSAIGYASDAADLLTAIKTVDGAGSGLDADLLDGNSSAYFATATGLSDHIADTTDAHDASAISYLGGTGISATDVEAALDELANEKADLASPTFTGNVVVPDADAATEAMNQQTADARYVRTMWLPATGFSAISGSPVLGATTSSRKVGWLLDSAASTERLEATFYLPAGWTSATVTILWANSSSGSGDVRFAIYLGAIQAAQDLNVAPNSYAAAGDSENVTATAGTQWLAVLTTTPAMTVSGGKLNTIWVERLGSNVADTLGNDCTFFGCFIEKV